MILIWGNGAGLINNNTDKWRIETAPQLSFPFDGLFYSEENQTFLKHFGSGSARLTDSEIFEVGSYILSQSSVTAPGPSLEQRQDTTWEAIKIERDKRIYDTGVLVGTNWFYSDTQFRDVITQSARLFSIDERSADDTLKMAILPELDILRGNLWKTMSGQWVGATHLLTAQIDAAHAMLMRSCYMRGETHKALMLAATNPETYDFSTGWPLGFLDT